jgi:hypothetical protein
MMCACAAEGATGIADLAAFAPARGDQPGFCPGGIPDDLDGHVVHPWQAAQAGDDVALD